MMSSERDLTCTACGCTKCEALMPAWIRPTEDGPDRLVSIDADAEPLSFFCPTCDTNVEVRGWYVDDAARTAYGRWS